MAKVGGTLKELYSLPEVELTAPPSTIVYEPLILTLAISTWERTVGLIAQPELSFDKGLLIGYCKQVHTFFMRYPIDVIFCSADFSILRIIPSLKPWRISPFVYRAAFVIELKATTSERMGLVVGQTLTFEPILNRAAVS